MLAVNRTDKVIGRIKILIDSINTIKFIKKTGVPCGTRWIKNLFVFLNIPKIKVLIHRVIAKNKLRVTCDVLGKFWGNKAMLFIMKIMVNNVTEIKILPFLSGIMNFISCLIFFNIKDIKYFPEVLTFLRFIRNNKRKV